MIKYMRWIAYLFFRIDLGLAKIAPVFRLLTVSSLILIKCNSAYGGLGAGALNDASSEVGRRGVAINLRKSS
jgi:hypothetical protein